MLYRTLRKVQEFQRIPYPLAATAPRLLSPRYRAARAAVVIFCLGFGALNVFSALGLGDPRLPGLYSFRAATVGDGILLPVLAYALVRAADPRGPASRFQTRLSAAGGVLGVLAGAGVQAGALMDPDARLDWTFPALHDYNLPGWYHAVFLIAASGFFAQRLALLLAQTREEARDSTALALRRVQSVGILAVLIPGLAFLGLLEEDTLAGAPRVGGIVLVSLLAFGAVLCAGLCWACGRSTVEWCVLAVLGALLPALTLCDLFLPGHAISVPAALLSGAVGLAIIAVARTIMERRAVTRGPATHIVLSFLAVCEAVCAVGPVYAAMTVREVTAVRLAAGAVISLLLSSEEWLVLRAIVRAARQYQPNASS